MFFFSWFRDVKTVRQGLITMRNDFKMIDEYFKHGAFFFDDRDKNDFSHSLDLFPRENYATSRMNNSLDLAQRRLANNWIIVEVKVGEIWIHEIRKCFYDASMFAIVWTRVCALARISLTESFAEEHVKDYRFIRTREIVQFLLLSCFIAYKTSSTIPRKRKRARETEESRLVHTFAGVLVYWFSV